MLNNIASSKETALPKQEVFSMEVKDSYYKGIDHTYSISSFFPPQGKRSHVVMKYYHLTTVMLVKR